MSDKSDKFYEKSGDFRLKTHVFARIFATFEVDIVVPESHLICDVRFWAGNGVPPPTFFVGVPTSSTIGIFGLLWVYSLLRKRKIKTYIHIKYQKSNSKIMESARGG